MKKSTLLILVASALFLSALSPSPQTTPTPSPRPTEHQSPQIQNKNKDRENDRNRPTKDAAGLQSIQSMQLQSSAKKADEYRQVERQLVALEESSDRLNEWLIWVGAINVAAAFLIFWATCQAANAANDSAKAGTLALKANRPYLLLVKSDLFGFRPPKDLSEAEMLNADPIAKFTFRNYGNGPALIEDVVLKMKPATELPKPKDFTECIKRKGQVEAVTQQTDFIVHTDFQDSMMSNDDIQAILNRSKTLIAYGCIRYWDVFGESYETGIFLVGITLDAFRALGITTFDPFLSRNHDDPADKDRNYYT